MEAPGEVHAQSQNPMQLGSQGLEAVLAPISSAEAERGLAASEDAVLQLAQAVQSPAVGPLAGKLGLAGGGRTTRQDAERLAHTPGTGESIGKGNGLSDSQVPGLATNAYPMAHDPAGTHGTTIAASGVIETSAGSATAPGVPDPFAALDAGTAPGKPAWIHAGAQQAEAGFQDPALGWVGVRADMSGGGVHAALVPGSADAALALGGHLAGLNSYLAEQHTPVETLTLAAPEARGTGPGMEQGMSQSMNQGTSQGFNQGENPQASQGAGAESLTNHGLRAPSPAAAASQEVVAEIGRTNGSAFAGGPQGVHISVMA